MASAIRTTMLRQALTAASSKCSFTNTVSAAPRFRLQQLSRPAFRQRLTGQIIPCSSFSTSQRHNILPPLPQEIEGTVNDAAKVPESEPSHGSYHWTFERILSAVLVPVTIAPFVAGVGYPIIDAMLIGGTIVHTYIGFQSIITDYLPKWRTPRWRSLVEWANVAAVFVVGWGFYEFETNDVGLTEGIKRIWKA